MVMELAPLHSAKRRSGPEASPGPRSASLCRFQRTQQVGAGALLPQGRERDQHSAAAGLHRVRQVAQQQHQPALLGVEPGSKAGRPVLREALDDTLALRILSALRVLLGPRGPV